MIFLDTVDPAPDEVVEAFLMDGANQAFHVSIGVWSAYRRMNDFDVLFSKDLIEGSGEFRIPFMEQMPKDWCLVFKHPAQLARLLADPLII